MVLKGKQMILYWTQKDCKYIWLFEINKGCKMDILDDKLEGKKAVSQERSSNEKKKKS